MAKKSELHKALIDQVQEEMEEVTENFLKKVDREHQDEIDEKGTFSTFLPVDKLKGELKKTAKNFNPRMLTKPPGSNPSIISRNKRICKAYDKLTSKGHKQIETERLLAKEYDLSPQTIRKIVKDPNNAL